MVLYGALVPSYGVSPFVHVAFGDWGATGKGLYGAYAQWSLMRLER